MSVTLMWEVLIVALLSSFSHQDTWRLRVIGRKSCSNCVCTMMHEEQQMNMHGYITPPYLLLHYGIPLFHIPVPQTARV